jgi:hypothetical protein
MNTFYKITNLINGKFYYGLHKTDDVNDSYLGSGSRILSAIKKYGRENFKKDVLLIFKTYQEALDFESEYVNEQLLLDPSCYNLRTGGLGGCICSEEVKKRISLSSKGRIPWNKGKNWASEKTKEKISFKRKGKNHSKETKEKIRQKRTGQKRNPLSEETKKKISAALKKNKN